MYGEVILKSELDAFKANNIPPTETVLAEWILKTLRKGRLISSHHVGNTYLIICTDTSLYFLKLAQKKIRGYKKYSLLDFTNIQVGYLSKTGEDALDECEVNPGLFAIRFYFTPDSFKTFKHPASDTNDDAQKALIQVIFSSIKATRRELYRNSPATVIPIPTNNNNNNNNHKNKSRSNSFASSSSSPSSPPALSRASSLKQDSFMITIDSTLLLDAVEHDPIDGVITITQKHFVFEPTVGTSLVELSESITIPLFKVAECVVLDDDDIPLEVREYVLRKKVKVLQLFADGQRYCFSILSTQADSTCARLGQWVQAAQDKLAQEIISMTTIEHPLLGQEENNTNFKGDSDIMSAKDVLYLQYKMPERYSMEKWEMVYSTTRHGISINTFYTKVAQRAPCIIVVEDVNHHVFGGYASEPWVKTKQVHYGSGESFLFKLKPVSKVFKWSKLNDYFMFSKPDFISFGSGGDGYGLWLDADFDHGSSATSDTYLNEQLSVTEIFKILKVEVWAPPVYFQKKQTRPLV